MGRVFSMPNAQTFAIPAIADFLARHQAPFGLTADPFARDSRIADLRNDLNPNTQAENHLDAVAFLISLADRQDIGRVFFDPPYSPRQIAECYKEAGLTATMKDTQNARFYSECRKAILRFLPVGGIVLSFGWNSVGMGREFERLETLLVCHGGAHNDTICVADRRVSVASELPFAGVA